MATTKQNLDRLVNRVNALLGISKDATIRHYKIEWAYGGCRLVQVVDTSSSILPLTEYLSKKELHLFMNGLITGLTLPTHF